MDAPPIPTRSIDTKLSSVSYLPIHDRLPPPPPPPITNLEIAAHQSKRRSTRCHSERNSKLSNYSGSSCHTTPSPDLPCDPPNYHLNNSIDLTNCTLNLTSEMSLDSNLPTLLSPSELPPPPDSLLLAPQLLHELQEEFIHKQNKEKLPPPIIKPKPSLSKSPILISCTSPVSAFLHSDSMMNNYISSSIPEKSTNMTSKDCITPMHIDFGVPQQYEQPKNDPTLSSVISNQIEQNMPSVNPKSFGQSIPEQCTDNNHTYVYLNDTYNYSTSIRNAEPIAPSSNDQSLLSSFLSGLEDANLLQTTQVKQKDSLCSSSDPNLLKHTTQIPSNNIRFDRDFSKSHITENNLLTNQTVDTLVDAELDELEMLLADLDMLANDITCLSNESQHSNSSNMPVVACNPSPGIHVHSRTSSSDGSSLYRPAPLHNKITRQGTLVPPNMISDMHHLGAQANPRSKSVVNSRNVKEMTHPAQRKPPLDRDSLFTTSLQVDCHYETLNDFDKSFAGHMIYEMYPPTPDSRYAATNNKTDKIKIAMEKLKLANIKRAVLKIHDTQGSYKMTIVDQNMTARQVCNILIEKNHLEPGPNWTLTEQLADLKLERYFEDHELVLNCISHWPRQHNNSLLFKNNPDKYLLLKKPQLLMPLTHPLSSFNDSTFDDVTRRRILIKELFQDSNLPRISGNLFMKEGKRGSWKRYFCVLRASGLYFAKPGKTTTKDLTRLVSWEDITLYRSSKYSDFYKSPHKHCFTLRPNNCPTSPKTLIHFSFQNKSQLEIWITGITLAKHSLQLLFNYQENFALFPWLENDIDLSSCSPSTSMTNVVPRSQESALTKQERAQLHTEVPNLNGSNPIVDSFNFLDDQRSRKSSDASELEKASSCGKSSRIADSFSKAWSISEGIEHSPKSFKFSRTILPYPDRSSQLSSSTQTSSPGLVYEPPRLYSDPGSITGSNHSGKKVETFV